MTGNPLKATLHFLVSEHGKISKGELGRGGAKFQRRNWEGEGRLGFSTAAFILELMWQVDSPIQ